MSSARADPVARCEALSRLRRDGPRAPGTGHDLVRERPLEQASKPLHLGVGQDEVGRPARGHGVLQSGHEVLRLEPRDLRSEVRRVVEGLLEVPLAVERPLRRLGRLDDDRDERGTQRARQASGATDRPMRSRAAIDEDQDTLRDERQ